MGKRLTKKEHDERTINKILGRIKSMEKRYSINFIRLACRRYNETRTEELRLKREIKEKEDELKKLKNRVRGAKK